MSNVRTGPYVQCTYMSICILYVNDPDMVNTGPFLEKSG